MDGLSSEWFALIQSVGIMGSLLMGAAAVVRDAKAREIENLLTLANYHRELWSGVSQRPELGRIFRDDADVISAPTTVAEQEFLNLVLVHFQTGWRLAKGGNIITLKELAADVRGFFSLPLPRAVWEKTKQFRNQKFVRFVEKALLQT